MSTRSVLDIGEQTVYISVIFSISFDSYFLFYVYSLFYLFVPRFDQGLMIELVFGYND